MRDFRSRELHSIDGFTTHSTPTFDIFNQIKSPLAFDISRIRGGNADWKSFCAGTRRQNYQRNYAKIWAKMKEAEWGSLTQVATDQRPKGRLSKARTDIQSIAYTASHVTKLKNRARFHTAYHRPNSIMIWYFSRAQRKANMAYVWQTLAHAYARISFPTYQIEIYHHPHSCSRINHALPVASTNFRLYFSVQP